MTNITELKSGNSALTSKLFKVELLLDEAQFKDFSEGEYWGRCYFYEISQIHHKY